MKKLFVVVSTPFWMVNIDFVPNLDLCAVEEYPALAQECKDLEISAALEKDPEAFEFLRRLPREFLFKVADEPRVRPGISLSADVTAFANLELLPARNSISAKAAAMGLPSAGARFETHGNETFLKVAGKDMACDLLHRNLSIKAKVPMNAGPSHEDIGALIQKLSFLKNRILEARTEEDPRFAAVLIGYELDESDQKLVFEKLINPKTMELTENWEIFGGIPSIKYDITKDAGPVEVTLSVPNKYESEIAKLEKKLSYYRRKPIQDFTAKQRAEFNELNMQKSELLRNTIKLKIQEKKYVR